MFRNYDVVIFDFDGTIACTEEGILRSATHALASLGHPVPDAAVLRSFIGPPLHDSFVTACGLTHEQADCAVAAYRARYAERGIYEASAYPGMPELLRWLRQQGIRVGVATGKPAVFTQKILENLGLSQYVEALSAARLEDRSDVKPRLITEVRQQLPGRALMVGDRKYDLDGARACGIDGLGVLYGYGSAEELRACSPIGLARTVEDIYEYIGEGGAC